jgi:DNA-binding transcriptional LysR family regulator
MIAVNLGVGILPLQACAPQIKAMDLKVVHLEDSWAKRNLLLATKEHGRQSPACTMLIKHLLQQKRT